LALARVCLTLARVCPTLARVCLIRMLGRENCADCYAEKKKERKFLRNLAGQFKPWEGKDKPWDKIDNKIKNKYLK